MDRFISEIMNHLQKQPIYVSKNIQKPETRNAKEKTYTCSESRRAWCCGSGGEAALPRPARRGHGGRVAPFGFPVGSPGGSRAVGPGLRWALGAGLLAGARPGGRRGFRFGRAPSEQQETRGARGSERAPPDMA
ncbi:hypothetical protein NDU88_000001 [Pleurodeles waltl]|uniref:Uncharacterized protein n=1 Tax=Pleurodeles waltl TaxID=8319 RepID=A0AAV7SVB3_PLEWA|nr:hypothetical protein NDU88_000001 [Pleurodeles waltl]